MDPSERQRRRELELRRENEEKDLEVERKPGPRPLEGLSGAHTTWTDQQDDRTARATHEHDEEASRRASEEQVRAIPEDDAQEE